MSVAERLLTLYKGREGCHAELNGHWQPVEGELTTAILERHLAGTTVVGVYLVRKDDTVNFGSADFDNDEDPAGTLALARSLRAKLIELGVPSEATMLSFSGAKGHHLDLFVARPIAAGIMRRAIEVASVLAELPEHEIFPKQATVAEGAYGSLLKLPLCIHPKTKQLAAILDKHQVKPCDPSILHHIVRANASVRRRTSAAPGPAAEPRAERRYVPGQRGGRIRHLFGMYNSAGSPLDVIKTAVAAENRDHFDPPKSDAELNAEVDLLWKQYHGENGQGPANRTGEIRSGSVRQGGSVEVTWTSTIRPRPVDYIWKGRIARGKLTVLGGDPGTGKGTLGIDIAARISTAISWPDGGSCQLGRVLLLTGEDDPEDTISPRLLVAGADRSRVGLLGRVITVDGEKRRINLDGDAELLASTAAAAKVDVIIIDPLSSYLGAEANSWRDSDMRRILDPLAEAAARYGIAVILVVHLTKATGGKSMYRFQGSVASIAAARFGFLIAPHPENPEIRVMACVKANLAAHPASLTFRIIPIHNAEIDDEVGAIEWSGTSTLTADDLLGKPEDKGAALERAEEFLLTYLADGPVPSTEVLATAKNKKIGRHSVWEAKESLQVKASKNGLGAWFWQLADRHASPSLEAESKRADGTGTVRHASDQNPPLPLHTEEGEELFRTVPKRAGVPVNPSRARPRERINLQTPKYWKSEWDEGASR